VVFLFKPPTIALNRMLSKQNFKTAGIPCRKISSFLQPIQNDLAFETLGICSITCNCGKVYIEQTGCSIENMVREHHHHIWLDNPDNQLAEYYISMDYCILQNDTIILAKESRGMDKVIREFTEIELHPNNMHRENGFSLSMS
jgi:hypothetical protein